MAFCLISSMVSGLRNQLIFWQFHLIELLVHLIGLGLLFRQLSTRSGMLFLFTNLSFMEFLVTYLAFFSFFSNRQLPVVQNGSLRKNIQLMLVFLKSPFLAQLFSCYKLMTYLMMLPVILQSMLMILLFTRGVIRHLICRNN